MIVKVKRENTDEVNYDKEGDAGIDIRANGFWTVDLDSGKKRKVEQESYLLLPSERILVHTGIKLEIPKGYYASIRDRSGLALNRGIHVLGGVGDETYRGEYRVILVNLGKLPYKISKGDRVAQVIIQPYERVELEEVDELGESERGEDGFGASGK